MKSYKLWKAENNAENMVIVEDVAQEMGLVVDFDLDEEQIEEITDTFKAWELEFDLHLTGDSDVDGWRPWDDVAEGLFGFEELGAISEERITTANDDDIVTVKKADGSTITKSYSELCEDLGMIPYIHFVAVTTAGTITWTLGKDHEIAALRNACIAAGYKMSEALAEA